MSSIKKRLERLEEQDTFASTGTPWWSLPPGVEPDWPRPLKHLSNPELQVLANRPIDRYLAARDAGVVVGEYWESPEDRWLSGEATCELMWRESRMHRDRSVGTSAAPRPEGLVVPDSVVVTEEDLRLQEEVAEVAASPTERGTYRDSPTGPELTALFKEVDKWMQNEHEKGELDDC